MRAGSIPLAGLLVVAGLALRPVEAEAQGSVGLSGGMYLPEDSEADRTEVFGLRGGYRPGPNFGLELNLSQVDLGDTIPADDSDNPFPQLFDFDFDAALTNLELSVQWFPGAGSFAVFGGPGLARLDVDLTATVFGQRFSESETADILTAHAGIAYEWRIGRSFYLRPEARVRRYFDDEIEDDGSFDDELEVSYRATDYEANVVLGWRIGGSG
jgi:hypothetical protein